MNDPRPQVNAPGQTPSPRRSWATPRVVDHGSLRWFVRAVSGNADDGHTGTGGGGGTMFSKPPQN